MYCKNWFGVIDVPPSIALGKVIETKALAPRGDKQQQLWCQGHKL